MFFFRNFRSAPATFVWMALVYIQCLASASFSASPASVPSGGIKFFDGKSLNGTYPWLLSTHKNDPSRVFRVENGLFRITGAEYGAMITNHSYSNYHLILEFKWGAKTYGKRANKARDSGLLVHSNGIDGGAIVNPGKWKGGLQYQMIEGGVGDIIQNQGQDSNGNMVAGKTMTIKTELLKCTQKNWGCWDGSLSSPWNGTHTNRWKETGSTKTFTRWDLIHPKNWDANWQDVKGFRGANTIENPYGQWNEMVVIASGSTVTLLLNDVKVNEATNVQPTSGQIQIESELAEVWIRKWEIWPLDQAPTPKNPEVDVHGRTPWTPTKTQTSVVGRQPRRRAQATIRLGRR